MYIKTKDGNKVTPEFKLQQLKAYCKDILPLGINKTQFKRLWALFSTYKDLPKLAQSSGICYMSSDLLRPLAFRLLIERGQMTPFKFMSAYSLIEIYLGHNEDITSIEQIESDLVILYLGYAEFENKRQGDIIAQLIEQQIIRQGNVWILFKGSKDAFASKYRELYQTIKTRKLVEISINAAKTSPGGEL